MTTKKTTQPRGAGKGPRSSSSRDRGRATESAKRQSVEEMQLIRALSKDYLSLMCPKYIKAAERPGRPWSVQTKINEAGLFYSANYIIRDQETRSSLLKLWVGFSMFRVIVTVIVPYSSEWNLSSIELAVFPLTEEMGQENWRHRWEEIELNRGKGALLVLELGTVPEQFVKVPQQRLAIASRIASFALALLDIAELQGFKLSNPVDPSWHPGSENDLRSA